MAEIKIEKKKPIWPWILIILIILAAIYFFWYYNDNNYDTDDQVMVNDTITQIDNKDTYDNDSEVKDSSTLYSGSYGTVRNEQSVADYLNFVDGNKDINQVTTSEQYRSGFFKLITATKRESEINNVDVSDHITDAMKNAEMLTNDPTTNQKAEKIKMTAENVSKSLKKIQEERFSNLSSEAIAVETASNNINSSGTVEEDSENIHTFFDKSAILLQKMDQNENRNQ